MIDIKDDCFLNNNINDIFDRKIEVGPILQFDLLQRLIEEFIKRQKEINDKVNNLETKIISISAAPVGMTDENILKYLDDSNINFEIEKDLSLNKDKKGKDNEKENEQNNQSNDNIINNNEIENMNCIYNNDNIDNIIENKKKNDNKKNNKKNKSNINNINSNKTKEEKEENNNDIINNNLNTNDNINNNSNNNNNEENTHIDTHTSNNQYRKLMTRVDKLEVVLKELMKKIINTSVEQKVNLDQLKSDFANIKKNDNKIKGFEKNINKINQALKDYNILDYFKTENSKDNQENENKTDNSNFSKMFGKKIDLIESKIKENEEEINKLKKGLNDSNTAINNYKKNYNDFVLEINSNINEFKIKHNNDINKLKNNLNENIRQIKEEMGNKYNQQDRKIKDAITELDENNNNINSNNNANFVASKVNTEKLNNITIELKNYINKSLSDTEKYLKSIINNLGLDNIRKDLINVHKELNDKLIKADLDYIDSKLNEIEIKLGNDNLRIEVVKKDIDLCNDTCTKSVKMIEYLSGQVVQAYQPSMGETQREEIMKKVNKISDIQLTNYINKNDFDKEIKSIYKKIEQTLELEDENYKFIQHLDSQLKLFATQNELRTMEQSILNLIEELKNELSKKFMEKPEILKNIRILELQIKNIYDNNGIPHFKEGDNWLLAKKPMNNYLCASCESYLGELKNKNIFLPWNKIPPHENKKYRMGSGFSKMLQLVNMDLMKNAEKINNNLSIKIDDRKSNQEVLRQLPRISSQVSMRHLNNSNTFSPLNNDNSEQRQNNSADGMDNLEAINSNNNQEQDGDANIEKNSSVIDDKENSPKLIRIIKKTRKDNN